MRSIRLSLLLCILGLLVLSLGATFGLVSNTVEGNFKANTERMRDLYEEKHGKSCELAREHVDKALLMNSKVLIKTIREDIGKERFNLKSLLVWTTGFAPSPVIHQSPFPALAWASQFADDEACFVNPHRKVLDYRIHAYPLFLEARREALRTGVSNRLNKLTLPSKTDELAVELWQLDLPSGERICGGQLDSPHFSIPTMVRVDRLSPPHFTTPPCINKVTMPNGVPARHLVTKMAYLIRVTQDPTWRRRAERGRPRGGKPKRSGEIFPTIYVHLATTKLSDRVAKFDAELESELAELKQKSQDTLTRLRTRLVVISLITFVVAVGGGYLLVHFGLRPVGRLSDAVSQVSEKDIRLPLDSKKLPVELRPIAECLGETLDSLKRAFAREKQAAADISHELRTPLAAMLTTLDVALRKPREAAEYRELLEDCRQCGQQMTQLVERMLALARLDSGADHLRPLEIDAAKLAHQCAAVVRPLADARNVKLTTLADAPAFIRADPDKLREVITNLLHNAVEYNKPDGLITLEVYEQDGVLHIEVSDTGIGMAPETRQHIFERFYREDPSREANTLHAGIGLALVKGYVDLMDGSIEVESQVDEGSTFRIHLPIHANGEE
ncbi:MAG: sensor histidine kinase [Gemmataceae bacterium]